MISRPTDLPQGQPTHSSAPRYWTVADLLTWTESFFERLGIANPRLDAELLLADAMGLSRIELYTGYRKIVEGAERERFRAAVERRRKFEPVAYILGVREFYSLSFLVNRSVLIPRPETEHLVDLVLGTFGKQAFGKGKAEEAEVEEEDAGGTAARILDLGTGSGNIVVSLLTHLPGATAVAVDASDEALGVARENATRHGVADHVEFVHGDLFAPLDSSARFSVIVSNPPYVATSEFEELMPDVRDYEPRTALLDTKRGDGVGFYREIVDTAPRFIEPGGLLAVEVDDRQSVTVCELLGSAAGGPPRWTDTRTTADYAGLARVVSSRFVS